MTHSLLTDQIRLSPQYSGRDGADIDTFLVHHQAGTNDDAVIAMMINRSRQVSANYTISNEGRLTCVVDEDYRAWTSGSSRDGGKGAAWDRRSITVEIENESLGPDWKISEAALKTAAELLADLRTRYNIRNVLGHRDLWTNYEASYATFCPGPNTVQAILNFEKNEAPKPRPVPPPVISPVLVPNTVIHRVAASLKWTGIQKMLKAHYGYKGLIDNIPGQGTVSAHQRFLKASGYEPGIVDGLWGPKTEAAIQRWLKRRWGYNGLIDNDFGPQTRAAWARAEAANGRAF